MKNEKVAKGRIIGLAGPCLDVFLPIGTNFFAPLHFPHSYRVLAHSSTAIRDHRQVVLNVLWQKNSLRNVASGMPI